MRSSNKRNDEQKERLRSVYKGGMGKSFTRYLVLNRDIRESEAVCSLSMRFDFELQICIFRSQK